MRVWLIILPGMEGSVERVCRIYREDREGSVPAVEPNEKVPRAVAQTNGRNNIAQTNGLSISLCSTAYVHESKVKQMKLQHKRTFENRATCKLTKC